MRIINCGRGPGLPDEPVPECLVRRQRRGQDLQRNPSAQPVVHSPEHHRHPARADLLLKPVTSDPGACGKAGQ
jgi:hypothetical protein